MTPKKPVQLDPQHPFEKLLIPMVETSRAKAADYAAIDDYFQNFRRNAEVMDLEGYTALEDCLSMVARKLGRIVNLRGREPSNEAVLDSFLDMAIYAILTYGLALEAAEEAE
jgi:hypothetical protein